MQKLSKDVAIDEQVKFETLLGNQLLVAGLKESGYERPSPIQLKAIPLGRLGTDLIAQAKSGTGKTVVFGVLALDTLQLDLPWPQVVIVAPTREIAVQIRDVIRALGRFMKGLRCEAFIGGIQDDPKKCQGCHVVVASPGRLLALMRTQKMVINHVRLWVLDEADKLIEARMEPQIAAIYSYLPKTIQCVAFSATFSEHLLEALNVFMNTPERICLTEGVPTLEEVQQYHVMIPAQNSEIEMYRAKFEKAAQLLGKVPFYQCMIFVNHLPRAVELTDWLNEIGWKSGHICASLNQHQRLAVMDRMRQFKVRILVCSDLIARGIDIDRVNLVINLDLPWEIETYLHRVGRTGRYGTSGVAINLIGPEDQRFLDELKEKGIQVGPLPDKVTYSEYKKQLSEKEQVSLAQYESTVIQEKPFRVIQRKRPEKKRVIKKPLKKESIPTAQKTTGVKRMLFTPPDLYF